MYGPDSRKGLRHSADRIKDLIAAKESIGPQGLIIKEIKDSGASCGTCLYFKAGSFSKCIKKAKMVEAYNICTLYIEKGKIDKKSENE